MLIFWTAAEPRLIKRTIGMALKAMRPDVPEHRFEEVDDADLPVPDAGDVVIVCGTRPLNLLKDQKIVPRNRAIAGLRETPVSAGAGKGWYLVSYDPGIVNSEPDKQAVIGWDIALATRLMKTGSMAPQIGEYRWVGSFASLVDEINVKFEKTGKPVEVSCDCETEGLYPWYPGKNIVSIAFTCESGRADCLYTGPYEDPVPVAPADELLGQIEWLLTSPKVRMRGANFKFDLLWIAEKWGIECTNFRFDNLLVASLVDENRWNSLNLLTKLLTSMGGYDDEFNRTVDKSQIQKVPPEKLLPYQGGDADATQRTAEVLKAELLEDGELARFYVKVLHPAARAFEKIERRGVLLDVEKYHKLRDDLAKDVRALEKSALALLPMRMRIKHKDKIQEQLEAGKSPFTPAILKEYFFTPNGLNLTPQMWTTKSKEPSTSKAHLQMFEHVDAAKEFCQMLEEMNGANKTISTFIEGFLNHLRPDGRLHPTYMLFHGALNDDVDEEAGTVTGRLSAKDPAFQILPSRTKYAKRIRECYPAPPGKKVFSADFQQGELRLAACIAPEERMIRAYKEGMDLHSITASTMAGMSLAEFDALKTEDPVRHKVLRTSGKAGNFGLLYGMGAGGFVNYAWAQYKVKITLAEAEEFRNRFLFEQWVGLPGYHTRMRNEVRLVGQVRSPLGRVRHLPMIHSWDREVASKAERQAINSPIQSTLSDMMLMAIAAVEAEMAGSGVEIVGMIHDSLIGYVDEKGAEDRVREVMQIMGSLPLHEFDWHPELTFPADGSVGPNLAQQTEVLLAA